MKGPTGSAGPLYVRLVNPPFLSLYKGTLMIRERSHKFCWFLAGENSLVYLIHLLVQKMNWLHSIFMTTFNIFVQGGVGCKYFYYMQKCVKPGKTISEDLRLLDSQKHFENKWTWWIFFPHCLFILACSAPL